MEKRNDSADSCVLICRRLWVIEVGPGDKYEGGAQAKTTATATTMPENSDLIG